MRPGIRDEATWSFRGGREIVERKGLVEELPAIAESYSTHGGGNQNLSDRREMLDPLGWDQEVSAILDAETGDGPVSRRVNFDAYKDGVLVEHERGEQMRANWHLLKMDAVYRDPRGFGEANGVDAAVLLIPEHVTFPTLERTSTDARAVLANYFGFSIPLFVWQYPTDR